MFSQDMQLVTSEEIENFGFCMQEEYQTLIILDS